MVSVLIYLRVFYCSIFFISSWKTVLFIIILNYQLTSTLKVTTAQVVETPVTVNNSIIQDYVNLQPTYNLSQNILGHLRKLGTKTLFAKLTHILPLKKAWGCSYKGLCLLSPSPPSSVDFVELKLECRQDKTRQCFIWSLTQSYVHRLYPNNLKS